jgi:hypothetical protein
MNGCRQVRLVGLRYVAGLLLFVASGCAGAATAPPPDTAPSGVYASPAGWKGGDGSAERPLDLAGALAVNSPAKPGDTVWLRGGRYHGAFVSFLNGTADRPIVVRPYPGERVIIDSAPSNKPALEINGSWTIFRDFEVMNSDTRRVSAEGGSFPSDLRRGGGVDMHGQNTKIINLVIHDLAGGISMWRDAVNAEAYGNIVFSNGWSANDRAHGHGLYTQNETGTRLIADNIIFNQYGSGIHAFGSSEAYLDGIHLEGNVVFNNGIHVPATIWNILIGGGRVATSPVLRSNFTYTSGGHAAGNNLGYDAGCSDLTMQDNYFVNSGSGYAMEFVNCAGAVERNRFHGTVRGIAEKSIVPEPEIKKRYPQNIYESRPTGVDTFVRPNRYEPGRAHVIVFNWDRANDVSVDLSDAGLASGAAFEIRDVHSMGGDPVASGTYSGSAVTIPMSRLTVVTPLIGGSSSPKHPAPEFSVFLLTSTPPGPSWLSSMWSSIRGLFGQGS